MYGKKRITLTTVLPILYVAIQHLKFTQIAMFKLYDICNKMTYSYLVRYLKVSNIQKSAIEIATSYLEWLYL